MKRISGRIACGAAAAALVLALQAPASLAKEFLVGVGKPNQMVLIDAAARKVERVFDIPGPGSPSSLVPSPDGKVAFVITNRWESISGIDLDSGDEVFRADFSTGDMRVKGMFGMVVSRDGSELFVIQSSVKLKLGEYEVQDTRIAVFDTGAGKGATPLRTFTIPRRSALLHLSTDGAKLYVVGWDIYVYDPKTGTQIETLPGMNWDRPNYYPPDIFGVWSQYERAEVYANPYFTLRSDMSMEDPAAWKTGMLTLDLKTGELKTKDFENTEVIIFSAVVNPVRRNESYGVYTTLTKIDHEAGKVLKRVNLDHTYYSVNISGDGSEIYIGGTQNDVAVYSTDTLEKLGAINIPGGVDQGLLGVRVINR